MINRPYVDWKSVKEAKDNAISGNDYLVVLHVDDTEDNKKVADFDIVKWYNAGDRVGIICKNHAKGNSPKEVLLNAIFGEKFEYIVEESGFYRMVFDLENTKKIHEYNIFRDNDCEYGICKVDNITYWSGLPIPPDGYITNEEADDILDISIEAKRKKEYDEEIERMNDFIQNDDMLSKFFNKYCEDGISKDIKVDFRNNGNGVDFHTDTFDAAKSVILARYTYDVIDFMIKEGITYDDVSELTKKRDVDSIIKLIDDITEKLGVDDIDLRKMICHIFCNYIYKDDFYTIRNIYLHKYKNRRENTVKILIKAYIDREILFETHRIYSLLNLGKSSGNAVPGVILENEFRRLAEAFIEFNCVDSVDNIDWVFKEKFGVNEDGSKYDGLETPKLKEKVSVDSDDEDGLYEVEVVNDNGITETRKMTYTEISLIDGFNDNDEKEYKKNKGEIGVDYPYFAVDTSPNYLMFDTKYVIYDNRDFSVVRDENSNCLLFNDWKKAMEMRNKLEKNLCEGYDKK